MSLDLAPVRRSSPRVPPNNLQAEQSLLGAMLLRGDAIERSIEAGLLGPDFYSPAHGLVFAAIVALYARGEPSDPVTVADELRRADVLDKVGGPSILISLQAGTPAIGNAGRYARIVADHAALRRMIRVGGDIAELGYSLPDDVGGAIETVRTMVADIELPGDAPSEAVDLPTFCAGEDTYDWLIPDLIERGDRLLVVAAEKGGKSVLVRQIAVTASVGLHPFRSRSYGSYGPLRVLLIDLENPVSLVRRKLRPLHAKAREMRPLENHANLSIICRPGGIDVTRRGDARWLSAQLTHARPDLVVLGPLYKLFSADDNWEKGARTVTTILDDLRSRLNFGLVMETHAPQGIGAQRHLRPVGSSIWMRWPEFVLTFAPTEKDPHVVQVTLSQARDERQWPKFLRRGGEWPWTPCRDPEKDAKSDDDEPPPDENVGPNFRQEQAW